MYEIENGEVILKRCFIENGDTDIVIPRTVDGMKVTTIDTDFFTSSSLNSSLYFYIPETITTINSKAFVKANSSYTWYFRLEADSKPDTWASDFYYNSYYENTSSNMSISYGNNF